MKPGMQRDLLVAYWLLFDEFHVSNDDRGTRKESPPSTPQKTSPESNSASKARPKNNRPRQRP